MLDEVTPPPRKTPDDWIVQQSGLCAELAGPDEDEGDQTGRKLIACGNVALFCAYFDLGTIEIEVEPDGTWKPFDPLVIDGTAAKATLFCEKDEEETTVPSLDEIARNFVQSYGPPKGSDFIPVEAWHWTKPIPFALTRREDGSYTFRQLAEDAS